MSESVSSPWIRNYFVDVAETHGAQLYNAPVSTKKKKVQLTDLLTCQENSYVWAWISDKDYRVPVRISKDAADRYRSTHDRSVIDSRFFLIFVSEYRPVFSPRPLGLNTIGNTPVSHLSLDIGYISSIGAGGHLFGNPRDLESDENMKEWVLGLRQDGGGGNILKLRKDSPQNKKTLPPPPAPPLPLAPAPTHQATTAAKDAVEPKTEQAQDFKRMYTKRWRIVDSWELPIKPAVERQPTPLTRPVGLQSDSDYPEIKDGQPPVEPPLDNANRLKSREPSVSPTSPHRTPSSFSLQRQGTPTDWSLSDRSSPPVVPDEVNTSPFGNGIQQHRESEALPTSSHLHSDTERHALTETATGLDNHSLEPPTPAQRAKCSPIPSSFPPSRGFSLSCSSPFPSQHQIYSSSASKVSAGRIHEQQLTHSTVRMEVEFDAQTRTRDTDKKGADTVHESSQSPIGEVQTQSALVSVIRHVSSSRRNTSEVSDHRSAQLAAERSGSQSSMHSLFSGSLENEQIVSSHVATFPIGQTDDKAQEKANPPHIPRHDPGTWQEPSFIMKNEGKAKARGVEKLDTLNVSKKRQRPAQDESPGLERAKTVAPEMRRVELGHFTTRIPGDMQLQSTPTVATRDNRPSTSSTIISETTTPLPLRSPKPRLANFIVNFRGIDLGKRTPIAKLDSKKDIESMALRTGRIRTLGEKVEKDGSVYII